MRRFACLVTITLFFGALTGGPDACAQGEPVPTGRRVQLSAASLAHFETAMQAISAQAQVTILAEGAPLHAEVTGAPLAALQQTVPPDQPVPLDAALTNIAAAFDYEVAPVNAHSYLLHKHYGDPADLPLVTYEEMVHALGEMLKVVKTYDSEVPHDLDETGAPKYLPAVHLVESLSPEQRAAAKSGLPLTALNPEQRQWAVDAENAYYLRGISKCVEEEQRHLQLLPNPHTQLSGEINGDRFMLLYHERSMIPDTPSRLLFQGTFTATVHDKSSKDADGASSSPSAAGIMANALPETVTLQVAATQNAPGLFADESSDIQVSVDKAIGEKPVTIFGRSFSTRPHLVRALAALYDLRLLVPNTKSFHLVFASSAHDKGRK